VEENLNSQITKRNLPRDVFLHLFTIIALYWSVISFITLCWQYINYFFPELNELRYGYQSYIGPIRFSVSSLIIIFPLFILASWYLNKIYRRETIVRDSKIRKWLIYLTLFVAALVIIGDLVSLIYSFLGGEITLRFILKAISLFVVASFVFGYYLDDVRRAEPLKSAKYFVSAVGAIVLILVIGAFFIVGSPNQARLMQLDEQRIGDLQNIQYQIVNFWQKKEQLPQNLSDLNDSISGFFVPLDPKTNEQYEYNIKDSNLLTFELCAVFSLNGNNQNKIRPMSAYPIYEGEILQNWDHGQGRVCFERTIDKDLYPSIDKVKR